MKWKHFSGEFMRRGQAGGGNWELSFRGDPVYAWGGIYLTTPRFRAWVFLRRKGAFPL